LHERRSGGGCARIGREGGGARAKTVNNIGGRREAEKRQPEMAPVDVGDYSKRHNSALSQQRKHGAKKVGRTTKKGRKI